MDKKNLGSILLYLAALFGILTCVNFVSMRHFVRVDFTKEKIFSLSEKSKEVTHQIQDPLAVYLYFNPEHEMVTPLKNLLKSYQECSNLLEVQWIDPYRDFEILTKLGELGSQLKVNSILIKGKIRHRFLTTKELGIYDHQFDQYGVPPKLTGFNGEAAITGAFIDLSEEAPPLIGLINNHGERDPHETGDQGISTLVQTLSLQGFQFAFVGLHQFKTISPQIKILVSVQPKNDFSDLELSVLKDFLLRGGALFLAVDPLIRSGTKEMMDFHLAPLLEDFGITMDKTILVDASKQIPYSRPDHLYVDLYSDCDIVKNLKGIPTLFFQARSLGIYAKENRTLWPLCATSEKGWGETNFSDPQFVYNEGVDKKGPVLVGAASEDTVNCGKLILFGDSDFLSNLQIKSAGNGMLLENCFSWMGDRSKVLGIPSKDSQRLSVVLSQRQMIEIFLGAVCAPPLFIALLGLFVWRRRR